MIVTLASSELMVRAQYLHYAPGVHLEALRVGKNGQKVL